MLSRLLARIALAAACALPSLPAIAEDPAPQPVVVELFTSQGCSSCPPVDALIAELAEREDVLPLAEHVDYWDYIGWPDRFARPEHTARQKAYARMAHSGSIYTPQLVVGGTEQIVGYEPMRLADLVHAQAKAPARVEIVAETGEGGALDLRLAPHQGARLPGQIHVDLVSYRPSATVEIRHGENAGKTIVYANIVTGWSRLGVWDGRAPFAARLDLDGAPELRHAVIVQEPGPGAILGALRLD
ncbi:MAG: DUF1223 domain-containing protein [Alphaproteobacteria bacterium]|nr:MAG: DUF1223 domain-containing protein [Alphaproteobacteria bacterium]